MIKFLFFSILMLPHLIFSQYSLYFGDFDYNTKTFAVYIENDEPVGGFQFQLTGLNLDNSYGGISEISNFDIHTSDIGVVLGFSFAGSTIPAGNHLLTYLTYTSINDQYTQFTNVSISTPDGQSISDIIYNDLVDHGDPDCSGSWDYNSVLDECGVCNGPGAIYECGCSNIENDYCDCENNQLDDCGICGGDNSNCHYFLNFGEFNYDNKTLDIMITNPSSIAGFQFEVSGLKLTGASGGIAALSDFTVQTGESVVLGFSFLGSVIDPSYNELLTTLSFEEVNDEISLIDNIVITDINSNSINYIFSETQINHGSPNCDGDFYGINDLNQYGCCFDYLPDCLGECNGSALLDDCGICNGDGYSCLDCFDLLEDSCFESPFCNWETDSINCSSFTNSYQCDSMDGCNWNSGGGGSGGGTYGGQGEDDDNEYRGYCSGGIIEIESICSDIPCHELNHSECALDNLCDWYDLQDEFSCIELPEEICSNTLNCNWITGSNSAYGDNSYCSGETVQISDSVCGEIIIPGCTIDIATNFNPTANTDDGSCIFPPLGAITFGHLDLWVGTLEVNLDCEYPIDEFIIDVSGLNITGCYGGTSEVAGFDIALENNTFIGTSNGESIPENSGLLFVLTFDSVIDEDICFNNSTITTDYNIEYEAVLDECLYIEIGCMDIYGLNYNTSAIYDDGSCEYADHRVETGMFYFSSDSLVIDVGESVQWDNVGGYHSVNGISSSLNGELFNNPDSFYLDPSNIGLIGSFTFDDPGIYNYDCDVGNHALQGMLGTIVVGDGGCVDELACNYLSENDFQYGDCIYAQENFDCNGDCLLVVDYCGVCGGSGQNGDINLDDIVNILDVIYLTEYILVHGNPNIQPDNLFFNDLEKCIADINSNDLIDIVDLVLIVNFILDF